MYAVMLWECAKSVTTPMGEPNWLLSASTLIDLCTATTCARLATCAITELIAKIKAVNEHFQLFCLCSDAALFLYRF